MFGDRLRFVAGPHAADREYGAAEFERLLDEQRERAVPVLAVGRRTWWLFRGRVAWEDEGYAAEDVAALLLERERQRRRRLERARDLMRAGAEPVRRESIPEEVRRRVFRRDGGRCAACGSGELLQFDHVIPVALGGASTEENLQLLCAPCNRAKGDSL
jgi:5-methylcytosine-specific restriction endonuclease McrA